jgi:hypothetical protein
MARRPVHPGEILADELEAVGLSSAELARTLDDQQTASRKSLPESGRSPQTRLCPLVGTSDQVPTFG